MKLDKCALHNVCNRSIKNTRKLGKFTHCPKQRGNKNAGYTFIDNGANILAVAHIDTVQNSHKFEVRGNKIYSPRLDDRLGVYTITELLPSLGVRCDVLLCEDEERGQSTAQHFQTEKEYNWIFEFDRGGVDVVMYQYDNLDQWELLEESGWEVGQGSYSDIADLDHLGVAGFNFGVAYYNYHSIKAYMKIDEYLACVSRFIDFYDKHKDTRLEYDPDESLWYADDIYWMNPQHYYSTGIVTTTPRADHWCTLCGIPARTNTEREFLENNGICIWCDDTIHRMGYDSLADYLSK